MSDPKPHGGPDLRSAQQARPHWVRIPPFRSPDGSMCGLCDGFSACEHPRVKCSRCGNEGLQENWPFDCCGTSRFQEAQR